MRYNFFTPFNCNHCLISDDVEDEKFNPVSSSETFQKLYKCGGCQLVKYCSNKHQLLDRPMHKEFCKNVKKLKTTFQIIHPFYLNGLPQSKENVERVILQLKFLLRTSLKRNLEFEEEELTSFPAYCAHCFNFKILLVICEKCFGQAYCSKEHRDMDYEQHAKVCDLLKLYYCPYKLMNIKSEVQLKTYNKVEDFQKLDLVGCFQRVFDVDIPSDPCQNVMDYQLYTQASDFSCIMTICYAVSYIKFANKDLNKFTIFVLGATVEATLWFRENHCRIFFLQNPLVQELVLNFIGPEVVRTEYSKLKFKFMGRMRVIKFIFCQCVVEDTSKNNLSEPSLIVAFNCGFSEFSSYYNLKQCRKNVKTSNISRYADFNPSGPNLWFKALLALIQIWYTPIVFTSFTEMESQFDFAALQKAATCFYPTVRIERIFKACKNPYHALNPLRQWYVTDKKDEFYYRNGYIQAVVFH